MADVPRLFDAQAVTSGLAFPRLIAALRADLVAPVTVPPRSHHSIPQGEGEEAVLLLMPAWNEAYVGVKSVTIHPDNGRRRLPAVHGTYLLSRASTGEPLAVIDGTALTARRTAA